MLYKYTTESTLFSHTHTQGLLDNMEEIDSSISFISFNKDDVIRKEKVCLEYPDNKIEELLGGMLNNGIYDKIIGNNSDKNWFFKPDIAFQLDEQDELKGFREKFHIPKIRTKVINEGEKADSDGIYLCGHSLGLQPKKTIEYLKADLQLWAEEGVEGHFSGDHPWVTYDEECVAGMAKLVGAKDSEVIVMNSLTVNLHLMLISFYAPTKMRYKILMEDGAFPSDCFAIKSQLSLRGYNPSDALMALKPRPNEYILREDDICALIEEEGDSIALVIFGGVNYYTGQLLDMNRITKVAHAKGCTVGFDLAHAVGNVKLELDKWDVDFAVWCTYKYLNSGPGGIGGCFVNEKYGNEFDGPRLSGWWSHEKGSRFEMKNSLKLGNGATGWQLSNPSILCLAAMRSSLELYDAVGMERFCVKSKMLSGYLYNLLHYRLEVFGKIKIISPSGIDRRGCQISFLVNQNPKLARVKGLLELLKARGVTCDLREPNCIRVAPNPFYNTFTDVFNFVKIMTDTLI